MFTSLAFALASSSESAEQRDGVGRRPFPFRPAPSRARIAAMKMAIAVSFEFRLVGLDFFDERIEELDGLLIFLAFEEDFALQQLRVGDQLQGLRLFGSDRRLRRR